MGDPTVGIAHIKPHGLSEPSQHPHSSEELGLALGDTINNVYMFHNLKFNLHLFINAMDLNDAMNQFDMCQFENRKYWKVFLETGHQPS